ncbi:mechanosensitive ion channel family protein [uncultured Croceicoccus sp.]|uniref:mechanosensitive ion channel family protein n=1 Tax=uncultured Croceicoccus sp. TaxID=1295329 RepID=UPI002612D047|nr:mechanosensitive ion channel family protein [uncultured Croceicoccus sp.]
MRSIARMDFETMRAPFANLPPHVVEWGQDLIILVLAVAGVLVLHRLAFGLLGKVVRSSRSAADNLVLEKMRRPTRYAAVAVALVFVAGEIPELALLWEAIAGFVLPALLGWIALSLFHALIAAMILRTDISVEDNLSARRRRTRLQIFSRLGTALIVFITAGLVLLSIPVVRDIGVTLVASAGLAGLAVGAAAQPALKSLIGGLQLALTEPIRIGDAVIIGGEWGWIEEIRTTYVVVKVWDERRLVVPTSKFLDEIFQNWTKTTSQLLGTVMFYVDPMTKLDPIREKFMELVESNARWDKRVRHMQVTELTRDAIEVRFLMTAKDSPTLFDLRCDIREALIQWIAAEMPDAIVRNRLLAAEPLRIDGASGPPSAAAMPTAG